jgi:GT2 family glycosyltransferase
MVVLLILANQAKKLEARVGREHSEDEMARVALVMPVHNEEAAVDETLTAILASTRLPDEIIIGDGRSTDRTAHKCLQYRQRGLSIKVVDNPRLFPGAGRNVAANATDCEILLFCDFGNRVEPNWVERMSARLESNSEVDFVIGMYYPLVKSQFEQCVACVNYPTAVAVQRMTEAERNAFATTELSAGGSSVACSRATWEHIGGFPEWLRTAEDKLFARKLRQLGARIVVATDTGVSVHMRSNLMQIFRQYLLYGRGDGHTRTLSRHTMKLLLVYAAIFGLFGMGIIISPWFLAAAATLFGAYAWRAALRRVMTLGDGAGRMKHIACALAILIVRDGGAILGNFLGRIDWLLRPIYRRNYAIYMRQ